MTDRGWQIYYQHILTRPQTCRCYYRIRGTQYYIGTKSYMCCVLGLTTLTTIGFGCFPGAVDTQIVYWIDGKYYDQTGKQLPAGRWNNTFRPTTATTKSTVEILQKMQR